MFIWLSRFRPRSRSQTSWDTQGQDRHQVIQELSQSEEKALLGESLLARGYFVNTVGLDEDMIRRYVKYQEDEERKAEQDRQDFTLF